MSAPSAKDNEITRLRNIIDSQFMHIDELIDEIDALRRARQFLIRTVQRVKAGKAVKDA